MEQEKPLGIVLVALFNGFLGLLLVPIGYVTAMALGVRGAPSYASLYGFLSMALGLLMLASAYGLWVKQPWGRLFAIRVEWAMLPISALGLLGALRGTKVSASHLLSSVLGMVLTAFILHYLRREDIRQMYEQKSPSGFLPEAPASKPGRDPGRQCPGEGVLTETFRNPRIWIKYPCGFRRIVS